MSRRQSFVAVLEEMFFETASSGGPTDRVSRLMKDNKPRFDRTPWSAFAALKRVEISCSLKFASSCSRKLLWKNRTIFGDSCVMQRPE